MVAQNMRVRTETTASQIKAAFAQLALLGFSPAPNDQTKSIINPTSGMAEIRMVIIQSLVEITIAGWFSISF